MKFLNKRIGFIFITCLIVILFIEICFRVLFFGYFFVTKKAKPDIYIDKFRTDRIMLTGHPYMAYVMKPDQRKEYPNAKYAFSQKFKRMEATNSMGFRGTKEYTKEKPEGVFRIVCLGGSTTANPWDDYDYHYPQLLENRLNEINSDYKFEVINAGTQGWTSAESLINYQMRLLDYDPDLVIVYHGVNDINPVLTPGFKSDYSHYRKSLVEFKPSWTNHIPIIKPWQSYMFVRYWLIRTMGLVNILAANTTVQKMDMDMEFTKFKTFERNLTSVAKLAHAYEQKVLFMYFINRHDIPGVGGNKFSEGLVPVNEVIHRVAKQEKTYYFKHKHMYENKYFGDVVHFTKEGMQQFANEIANYVHSKILSE